MKQNILTKNVTVFSRHELTTAQIQQLEMAVDPERRITPNIEYDSTDFDLYSDFEAAVLKAAFPSYPEWGWAAETQSREVIVIAPTAWVLRLSSYNYPLIFRGYHPDKVRGKAPKQWNLYTVRCGGNDAAYNEIRTVID